MIRSATLSLAVILMLFLSGCLGSTGPNESCEDFDRQEQAEYWEENGEKEGVVQTDSGLQYSVIEEGDGDTPAANSTILIEYTGRRINGAVFQSTENIGPQEAEVGNLISGLEEGVQLMKEGATYEFVIPSYLGYGETAGGDFCPGTTLIFELTLVEIVE